MKILSIDTSVSQVLSLAVSNNSDIIKEEKIVFLEDLSSEIVPRIEKLLREANLSFNLIDGFALDIGPGSFTGLRIGLSCIKAFSFATGKPLVGVSSLDILALGVANLLQTCSVIDAKRENVYSCLYVNKNNQLKATTPYFLTSIDCLLRRIRKKTLFVGDALHLYRDKIIRSKREISYFAEEKLWYPRIENLVKLAYARFKNGQFDDVKSIVPVYLYPQECQIKKV